MSSITKVDKDGLGMANVEVPVWFWRESCKNLPSSCRKVLCSQFGFDLRIIPWFVQSAQEPLLEYGLDRRLLDVVSGGFLRRRLLPILQRR